jgi:hypothetical protein
MVARRYQRDYQNLNLHKTIPNKLSEPKSTHDNTMVTRRYQRDYQNLNLHTDNAMVTGRYQRDYQNLNLHKTIPKRLSEPKSTHKTMQWSQEDTKEIIIN